MTVVLRFLGPPRARIGGVWTQLGAARKDQLLAYVALRGSWVSRSELAGVFWPEHAPALAFANLRKTLFRLQDSPLATSIELEASAVRVNASLDTAAFEQALRDERLADALALYEGDLLAGADHEASQAWNEWLEFERNRLRALWRGAALRRLEADPLPAEAQGLAARLLASDPSDEEAQLAQARYLQRQGERQAARRAIEDFTARLKNDWGLSPSASFANEAQALLGTAPATGSVPSSPADAGFVGREHELRQIADLLGTDGRALLTLTGPGGTGKSRLAREALTLLAPRFPGGACFVALEDLRTADEVPARIVRELGLGPTAPDALKQLADYLQGRRVVLVLDNFEHLSGAAPALRCLLQAGAIVIVTSRVRLNLQGEWVLPLAGLHCPDPEDASRAERFDAVRLFAQRATRLRPDFSLAAEADAVGRICRLTGGLPLALELAASWVRTMPCEAIASELAANLTQLRASEDASQPARHASIEAVFESSWTMLAPAEQDALGRLSVFRGGFTPEAAKACARASLVVLRTLTDKSLLVREGTRLALHPVVQQLARAKLAADAATQAEAAHGEFYLQLLAQSRGKADLGDGETLARLTLEADNWTAAWGWAVRQGAERPLALAVPAMRSYADHRGRAPEVHRLVASALAEVTVPRTPRFLPVLLAAMGHLEQRLDRFEPARTLATRALALARRAGDLESQVRSLNTLGACDARQGHTRKAGVHYRLALKMARKLGMPRYVAVVQQNLGQVEKRLGRTAEALALLLGALQSFRQIDDFASQALAQYQLGMMQCEAGQVEAGVRSLQEAHLLTQRHGLHRPRAYVLAGLAEAALKSGDHAAAGAHALEGLEICRLAGMRMLEATMQMHLCTIATAARDFAQARERIASAMAIALEVRSLVSQLSAALAFAELLAALGEPLAAARVFALVAGHSRASAQEREQSADRLEELGFRGDVVRPAADVDQLCAKVAQQAASGFAPLVAELGAGR